MPIPSRPNNLTDGFDHEVRLLDLNVVAAVVGDDQSGTRDRVEPRLVRTRFGVDFWAILRAQLSNGARRKRHLALADRVDEDQRNARRNPAPSRLVRRLPHKGEFRVKRWVKPVRIVSRVNEHHPTYILWVRSRKHSNVETAK